MTEIDMFLRGQPRHLPKGRGPSVPKIFGTPTYAQTFDLQRPNLVAWRVSSVFLAAGWATLPSQGAPASPKLLGPCVNLCSRMVPIILETLGPLGMGAWLWLDGN